MTERAREISSVQQVAAKANSIADAGQKAYGEEFLNDVSTVTDEAGPLFDQRGLPTALGDAVMDSDEPVELLRYLGQNPDEAEKLRGLSAAALGRRIARVEADMKANKPKPAPKPLRPVTAASGATLGKSSSDMTDAEWYAKRRGR